MHILRYKIIRRKTPLSIHNHNQLTNHIPARLHVLINISL